MPPPAVFYTITNATGFSQTVLQADFNAGTHGNAPNEVWWKYEPASDGILGLFCNKGGTFVPRLQLFKTDALTSLRNNVDSAYWYQVEGGVRYWIVVLRQPAGASNFDFTLFADTAVLNPTLDPGDIIINDDENASPDGHPYAAGVFTSAGVFKGFRTGIPGGEIGDSIPDGTQLWHDRYSQHGSTLALFSPAGVFTLALDTTPTLGPTLGSFPNIYGHPDGIFYVVNRSVADTGKVFTVTSGGVVSGVIADMSNDVSVSSVSNDGTILYYTLESGPDTEHIHRWDLVNDIALPDLYTVTELATDVGDIALTAINQHPGEILVLADDSLITYYQNVTQSKSVLLHIADDGTLLHSYTYPWGSGPRIDHISWDPQNPTYIRIWFFTDAAARNGRIGTLTIATGALTSFDTKLFASGINQTASDPTMFGPSSSCTMVTAKRSAALEENEDTGEGGSETIPTCCDEGGPPGGGDTGVNPDPVGTLPPWMASCTGGGLVDSVADLADGESWL